jgi:prepilin-type N-terminal cleavage/methylation domain-containing protein
MNKLIKQAFTLIELLVVIAIVGILSGLIIVTMSGATQQATIAKAQVFSNSLRNSLLMNLVSEWKFNGTGIADGATATTDYTQDTWGGGNNCTIAGAPLVYSGSNCIDGSCLGFNGSTDYVDCGNNSSLNFGTGAFSISFWVNALSRIETYSAILDKSGNFDWTNTTVKTGFILMDRNSTGTDSWRFYLGDGTSSGPNPTTVVYLGPLNNQGWIHIVITVDAVGEGSLLKAYKNGVLYGSGSRLLTGSIDTTSNLNIGRWRNSDREFNGKIDDVRIYNATMPTSQIQEQYYAGLNELLASKSITKEDYQNRIGELTTAER